MNADSTKRKRPGARRDRMQVAPASDPVEKPELRGAQVYLPDTRTLVYALKYAEGLRYLTSDRRLLTKEEAERHFIITTGPSRRTKFSRAAALAFQRNGTAPQPAELFARVVRLFREHVYWPSPHTPVLLALWVMGTYVFQVFTYFPYIALNSADKRSGKSLVEEIMSEVAFNATAPMVGVTAATIYRDIHFNDSTLILDEVETLREGDKAIRAATLAVLCAGFKKGGTVPRCEPQANGAYAAPSEYSAYSPKMFAGINEVAAVIRDRSISILMERKPKGVQCQRFNVTALAPELRALRDDLHAFGLASATAIARAYMQHAQLVLPELDDRGRDIFEPLAAVAHIVGAEAERALCAAVAEIASQRRADDASTEGELETARAVLIEQLGESESIVLRSDDALTAFQKAGLSGMDRAADAQAMLRRLGFRSGTHRCAVRGPQRGYKITRAELLSRDDPGERAA